jgi:hypothetical protein
MIVHIWESHQNDELLSAYYNIEQDMTPIPHRTPTLTLKQGDSSTAIESKHSSSAIIKKATATVRSCAMIYI